MLKEPQIGKFDEQYTERYKIIELIGDGNAKLDLESNRSKTVHFDKLIKILVFAADLNEFN